MITPISKWTNKHDVVFHRKGMLAAVMGDTGDGDTLDGGASFRVFRDEKPILLRKPTAPPKETKVSLPDGTSVTFVGFAF